jgi:hypothetical protein
MLEAISIYWQFLAYIPKGILEKIRKFCFNFLWSGKEEAEGVHWTRWKSISKPNNEGGWGLKNIHTFGVAIVGKSMWNLITKENLWNSLMWQKYLVPYSILTWIRREEKSW